MAFLQAAGLDSLVSRHTGQDQQCKEGHHPQLGGRRAMDLGFGA